MSSPWCFLLGFTWRDSPPSLHLRALGGELARRGHRVILLVDRQRFDLRRPEANPAIEVWPSPRPVKARDARFLLALLRRHRPRALIANQAPTNLMMLLGWLRRVPVRVAWHRTLTAQIEAGSRGPLAALTHPLLRARKRLVYRAATHLIANSEASREDLERHFAVPARRCRVFLNSLADPLPALEAEGAPAREEGLVVCPGRFHPSKGQDVLLRALPAVRERFPGARLEFLGGGPTLEECRRLAEELGVEAAVTFRGTVPRDEVARRLAAAAVAAVPSRSEAFGMVNVEAMAVGTPVVASRAGGIPEVVRDGEEGRLVPPGDPAALAAALSDLLAAGELRRRLGAGGRRRFLERFEQGRAVAEQAGWLEALCARSSC